MTTVAWDIEPVDEAVFGPCTCCGGMTRRVWGFVHQVETVAAYFVEWTPNSVDLHDPIVDLVVGKWGDGSGVDHRSVISLAFRRIDGVGQFMVVDAVNRPSVARRALGRAEVIGTESAGLAFDIVDQIWLNDGRLAELTSSGLASGDIAPGNR